MEKPRLAQVVDWEKHIAPYRIIEMVAGVGAGKNYWVENVLMQEHKVLLITSRKAKVEETSLRSNIPNYINLNILENRDLGVLWEDTEMRYRNCVCNNSQIESYVKYTYNPENEKTHLWKYFDVIVVDEAHSLATDATFATAPFHLASFLNVVRKKSNAKIIFMTATPTPLQPLLQNQKKSAEFAFWDFTDTCTNVHPNLIHIVTHRKAIQRISKLYSDNAACKVVYFVNTIEVQYKS